MAGGTSAEAAEAAAASINQEQLFHEMEHKYMVLKAEFTVLESERELVVKQKNDAQAELKKLQVAVDERDVDIVKAKEQVLKLQTERDQLGFQVKAATSTAERRLNEIEELQQTIKEQSSQLIESQRKEMEALQRAAEQESQVEPLRHTVNRLNNEHDAQKEHLDWIEKQLTEKTKIIQELRQTAAKLAHDHEELKVRSAEESMSLKKQLESSRQVSKKLESALVHSKETVKQVQAAKVHEEERFQNELGAQRRLAELYKESAEDASNRINELQQLTESLRKSLAESEDKLTHQEERTTERVEHLFREQAASAERRIEALQGELQEAHSRLEDLQKKKVFSLQAASTAAGLSSAAGEAHLAQHGLTPKELYDQIVDLENKLREERDEKEQLKIYMDRVVKEVHEKAPMIMGLKLDLERAVASHAQISERLEVSMQELVKCRSRESHAWQEKQTYEKKCESLATSVDDLSRQVQHLLFRAHEASQSTHISPGEVVSENLVVFKDVEELQIRNQQLLMVIREITDAKKRGKGDESNDMDSAHLIASGDSDSDGEESESSPAIAKRYSIAQKEIEDLRAEREEERQMIAAIVKQRDMYRVLLAQADSKFADRGVPSDSQAADVASSSHHRRSSMDLSDSRAMRDLQKEFDTYKKEKQANMKLLQESLDQSRDECAKFRLARMEADVEAKCHKDRFEAADRRRQDAEDEILRLRGKTDQLNALLIQHQKLLSESEAKLEAVMTRTRSLEVQSNGAQREISFLKKNEEKALEELSALRLNNTNLLKMMDTSRQIESAREERESRDSERLAQKVVVLENKLQDAYDRLESNEAVAGAKYAAEEQAKKVAIAELDQAKEQLAAYREQIIRHEEQYAASESKASLLEKEVTHLREQLRKGTSVAAAERVSSLEVQLREAQREVQASVELKKSLTEAVAKYKAIAEANEKSLGELSSASERWKVEQEEKFKVIEDERTRIRQELEKARAQIKGDVTEGNKLREEMDQMVRSHQDALQKSQSAQMSLQLEANSARMEVSVLREEVLKLREDVTSAQENYERELKLHASQVEKYAASRKLVQEEQRRRQELANDLAEAKARVEAAEHEAVARVSSLEALLAEATEAKSGLAEQNKLLHSQLERANNQLRRSHEEGMLKSIGESIATSDRVASTVDHDKELDDLRSVIAFLRKETEILSSKYELSNEENQRHRLQIPSLEATIDRLREDIRRAETASANLPSGLTVPSQNAMQSAQLAQLDLLRESNATLREECQKNLARAKAEEERVKNLEAQMIPLRTSESLLKAQIDALKQEVLTVSDANKRWKQRVEQLVEKYQQIDPAEHEKVCAEKIALSKELQELKAKEVELRSEVEKLKSSEGKSLEEEKGKAENLRKQYDRIKGFAKTWKTKAEGLTKQVAEKTKEAEDKVALISQLEKKLAQTASEKSIMEAKISTLESSKADSASAASTTWEKERQDMKDRVEAETKKVGQLKDMNSKLLTGMKALKQENFQLKGRLSAAAPQPPAESPPLPADAALTPAPDTVKQSSQPVPPTASSTLALSASTSVLPTVPASTAPIKSPPRTEVSVPAQAAAPIVKAPTLPVVAPPLPPTLPVTTNTAPKSTVAQKPIVAPIAVAPKAIVAPVPDTVVPTPTKAESKPATGGATVSAEEKLRLFALQSMKKQFSKAGTDAGVKPSSDTVTPGTTPSATPTKPLPVSIIAKPPLPGSSPPKSEEDETSAGPFSKKLSAPTGGFGSFGSGGASGLVFGKPGISLPIPASPTPAVAASAPPLNAFSAINEAPTSEQAVPPSGEAQRRSQRLARFGVSGVAATQADPTSASAPATLKRGAPADFDSTTPQKLAKVASTDDHSANVGASHEADSQETVDEATVTVDSQETEVVPTPTHPPAENE